MFDTLTKEEKDQLRRTLEWVLVATQTSEETTQAIQKAIEMLRTESPVGPEVV